MINRDLNVRKLKYEFQKNGIVSIQNWLDEDYANALYRHLDTMPEDWWWATTFPGIEETRMEARIVPENASYIHQCNSFAKKQFTKGYFSYRFKRTVNNHGEECSCPECKFRVDVISSEVQEFLKYITEFNINRTNELFASYYTGGDFLSPHSDGPNGQLGFVYNLSKNWRPEYGGNLFFQSNENLNKIEKVLIPSFNTLTMFDLSTTQGHSHFVSEVVENVPSKRLAMTGWWGGDHSTVWRDQQ